MVINPVIYANTVIIWKSEALHKPAPSTSIPFSPYQPQLTSQKSQYVCFLSEDAYWKTAPPQEKNCLPPRITWKQPAKEKPSVIIEPSRLEKSSGILQSNCLSISSISTLTTSLSTASPWLWNTSMDTDPTTSLGSPTHHCSFREVFLFFLMVAEQSYFTDIKTDVMKRVQQPWLSNWCSLEERTDNQVSNKETLILLLCQ